MESASSDGRKHGSDFESEVNKRAGIGCLIVLVGGVIALVGLIVSSFIK